MSEHVLDWIGAYHDGELRGDRRSRVETHLRACPACQAELEALQALAARLQANPPMPARLPPEQFVAQVRLRLAPRGVPAPGHERLRQAAGLWLPLGVLALWAVGQAGLLAGGLALGLAALPPALLEALPTLPALGALPVPASALAVAPRWAFWLDLLALDLALTALTAALAWGCLAAWWVARRAGPDPNLALPGEPAG